MSEISEQLLPPGEANEKQFRLLLAVLEYLRSGGNLWQAITYFQLWSVRLAGFLPDVPVGAESRAIAQEMLVTPVSQLTARKWSKETCADLRRFLIRQIEEHVERKLLTPSMLESL